MERPSFGLTIGHFALFVLTIHAIYLGLTFVLAFETWDNLVFIPMIAPSFAIGLWWTRRSGSVPKKGEAWRFARSFAAVQTVLYGLVVTLILAAMQDRTHLVLTTIVFVVTMVCLFVLLLFTTRFAFRAGAKFGLSTIRA
ncbi:MAG: ABZJ_00895 family protein [Pseudomonadota bacterium]